MDLFVFDLVGCFAFAFYGATKGLEHKFGALGVCFCGFLTALGGGTLREISLHHQPVYFHNDMYLALVLAGCAAAVAAARITTRRRQIRRLMQVADGVGVSTFALIGASSAVAAGLGLAVAVMFAVLTALGGGLLTDLLIRQPPALCRRSFHAAPAIIIGALYWLLRPASSQLIYALLAIGFMLQLGITYRRALRRFIAGTSYGRGRGRLLWR